MTESHIRYKKIHWLATDIFGLVISIPKDSNALWPHVSYHRRVNLLKNAAYVLIAKPILLDIPHSIVSKTESIGERRMTRKINK